MTDLGPLVLSEGQAPISAEYAVVSVRKIVTNICGSVVFVHGLRGNRLKTWTKDDKTWPRDLLPHGLPNVRVISWGYDADVVSFFDNASRSSIFNHAQNLLEDLQLSRRRSDEKTRPLIFVAHSLGGLVVKDALYMSHEQGSRGFHPRLAAILPATIGIIFLGTPHRGSNKAAWASIATNLAKLVLKDHNDRVVNALCRGSETLERLQHSFSGIASDMKLFSFFEDQATSGIGKVVDDDSASLGLPHERKLWLPANHSDMVKFHDTGDVSYKRVAGAIYELVEDHVEDVRPAANLPQALPNRTGTEQPQSAEAAHIQSPENLQQSPLLCLAITTQEHRHHNSRLLNFGMGETIEDVKRLSGLYWQGRIGNVVGYFPQSTVQLLEECEQPQPTAQLLDDHEQLQLADAFVNPGATLHDPSIIQYAETLPPLSEEDWLIKEARRRGVFYQDPRELLIHAVKDGDATLAKISLKLRKADPNTCFDAKVEAKKWAIIGLSNNYEISVLWASAKWGHAALVDLLLKSGARIDYQAENDWTALSIAAFAGHTAVVRVLADNGADINSVDYRNATPIQIAAGTGQIAIVRFLGERGALLNNQDDKGWTALHEAVRGGHEAIAWLLCEMGADAGVKNERGQMAEHIARVWDLPSLWGVLRRVREHQQQEVPCKSTSPRQTGISPTSSVDAGSPPPRLSKKTDQVEEARRYITAPRRSKETDKFETARQYISRRKTSGRYLAEDSE